MQTLALEYASVTTCEPVPADLILEHELADDGHAYIWCIGALDGTADVFRRITPEGEVQRVPVGTVEARKMQVFPDHELPLWLERHCALECVVYEKMGLDWRQPEFMAEAA